MVLRRAFRFGEQSAGCPVYGRGAEQKHRLIRAELLGRAGHPATLNDEVGKSRSGGQDLGRILSRPGGQRIRGPDRCEHLGGEIHADGNDV